MSNEMNSFITNNLMYAHKSRSERNMNKVLAGQRGMLTIVLSARTP